MGEWGEYQKSKYLVISVAGNAQCRVPPALPPSLPTGMIYGQKECHGLLFPSLPAPPPTLHGPAAGASWHSQASYHLTMSQIRALSLEMALKGAGACGRTAGLCRGEVERKNIPFRMEGRAGGRSIH